MNKFSPGTLKYLCLSLLVAGASVSCTQQRPVKNCETFVEMADPSADTLSDWSQAAQGLQVSYVSIDNKYGRSVLPTVSRQTTEKLVGWKGEKLSAQVLLWTSEPVEQVEVEISEFASGDNTLSADIAQARFVRYVMTDEFGPGCGYRQPQDFASSLMPDMLDNIDCFNVEAKTARPVWITVDIPRSAVAGNYKGTVEVFARNQKTQKLNLEVEVQDKVLPPAREWTFHLDLWQHPAAVARVGNLEMWSDAHFEALKPMMQLLADAGQKVITATLNKDPWHNQCYDAYADMITWTKNADGTWTYDYTVFDRWVNMMLDMGVNKMINCYSVVPWNNEIHYKDGKTGELVNVKADPGTKIFDTMWHTFFVDFKKHIADKGWTSITNIAMDERTEKEMAATIKMLQREVPEFGISYADNQKSYKKYPFVKDISIAAGASFDQADIIDRQERGLTTTYYVCCSDQFPNMFTFSGSAESVYAGWYAMASGFDGFLRWAYNSWVENPLTDSRFRTWPAGDTYIVYPDARSSIRFERLLEGIQDVEKVRILRAELAAQSSTQAQATLTKLDETVASFKTITPAESYVDMVNKAKALVNNLSR